MPEQYYRKEISLTPDVYLGRKDIISVDNHIYQLHQQISRTGLPLVLHGVGGSGKTTFCYEYIKKQIPKYDYWAFLSFRGTFFDSFLLNDSFIKYLLPQLQEPLPTIEEVKKLVVAKMKNLDGKKLLVLDGFDTQLTKEERKFLRELKQQYNYDILISSRHELESCENIAMFVFEEQKARHLYKMYFLGSKDYSFIDNNETWKDPLLELEYDAPTFEPKKWKTDEAENNLIAYVKHHPLLLELLAKTLKKSVKHTASSMLELSGGTQSLFHNLFFS